MKSLRLLKRKLAFAILRWAFDDRGGMSLGGPGTNTLRDISNTINSGMAVPADPVDSVQYHNPQNTFDGDAKFRFQESNGVLIGQNVKLNLSSNGGPGDVYWIYNSTNDYMELYTDGNLRAQF